MAQERLFGTDGIRARAGEGPLRPEALLRLSRVTAAFARSQKWRPLALMAHDGRRSAGMIGASFAAGLLAEGFELRELDLLTTPGLAYSTKKENAGLGIMISASHNPAEDNGIKIFGPKGSKLSSEAEASIENSYFDKTARSMSGTADHPGKRYPAPAIADRYLENLARHALPGMRLTGMRLVVDASNGAGSHVAPTLFRSLGARIVPIFCSPDGRNINRGCGAVHPQALARRVRKEKAHLGIALDGDGDRAIFADDRGEILDGDGTLFVLARDLLARRKLAKKTVVATVMSNLGLRVALAELGVTLRFVGVGDRQVVEALQGEKLSLGGEQSGHIVFGKDFGYLGDGLYTALRLLDVMRRAKKPLSELRRPLRRFPQVLRNVRVASKPPFEQRPRIVQSLRGVESRLGENGRVLLRYSGTEPLARVMVEGPDLPSITNWAEEIAATIAAELS